MAMKAAVIGTGPLGLLAAKNLKEQGFDVTAFERRNYLGGLWKHTTENIISVNPNTVFNSSRYRCAFTDYPFSDDVDDFPTCQQMYDYLHSYADHFDIRSRIQLNTEVQDLKRINGKWEMTLVTNGSETRTELFDKVMVATGTFQKPKRPDVPGIESFAGDVRHAITFSPTEEYRDKKVLIIGFHASAVDISSSLANIASKIYLSRKNGVYLLSKFTPDGRTMDQDMNMNFVLFQMAAEKYFPRTFYWLMNKVLGMLSKKAFPGINEKHGFLPAPSIETTTPVVADQIMPYIRSGFIEPIGAVAKVTGPKSVELRDGTTIDNLDAIIFSTGYHFSIPFIPKSLDPYPVLGEAPVLYQNIFPLDADEGVRNSLAFMGQGASVYPGFALLESVAMAVAQVWKGREKLPPLKEMQKWHQDNVDRIQETKSRMTTDATFYPVLLPLRSWWTWIDKTAGTNILEHYSWTSWNSWKFWWQDREIYNLCKSRITSPALFRLFESGKRESWAGARSQIIHDNQLAVERAKLMRAKLEETHKTK